MPLVAASGQDASAMAGQIKSVFKMVKAGAEKNVRANFYIAAAKNDYAMVAFLTKKDKAGSKTQSEGKKLRKAIKGAKWCRGIAHWDGDRFVFEVGAGNLSKQLAKDVLRNKMAKEGSLGFLKRAVLIEPQEDVEQAVAEDSASDAAFKKALAEADPLTTPLTDQEQAELDSIADDESLSEMRSSLSSFLSMSEEDAEAQLQEGMKRLDGLIMQIQDNPDDAALADQLQQQHQAILALADYGPNVFAQVPGVMEDVGVLLNLTASGMGTEAVEQRLRDINDDFEAYLGTLSEDMSEDNALNDVQQRIDMYCRLQDDALNQLEALS